jgi:choice-of-anchor C domain-containing protein
MSKTKNLLVGIAFSAVAALGATSANAYELITNGSFENAAFDPGSFTTLNNGSTDINGWTVGLGSIDYIGSYWQASNGSRSLDLSGVSKGSISQTINTIAGKEYTVKFDMAGNPDDNLKLKLLVASLSGNLTEVFNFNATGTTNANMGWISNSYKFIAGPGNTTTLSFASATDTAYGPALDNVSVSAVPEPATWAMMIIGFGAAGSMVRSNRRKQAVSFA